MSESQVSQVVDRSGYRSRDRCRSDLLTALRHYKGLNASLDFFIFNDGTRRQLIKVSGTIPVPYKSNTYNIPVAIWLLDTHPMHAPMCFVCPTANMAIKVSRYVDMAGKVYLPYLHEWNASSSDLLGLIQICIIVFSEEPPVFAISTPQQTIQMPPTPPHNNGYNMPYPPPSNNMGYGGSNNNNSGFSPYPMSNSSSDASTIQLSLVSAAEDRVRRVLQEEVASKRAELESLERMRSEMESRQRKLKSHVEALNNQSSRLEQMEQRLRDKQWNLEEAKAKALFKGNEEAEDSKKNVEVDELVLVQAPLYAQMLNAHAEDVSIDDALYYLGEALRLGRLDCEAFLKHVRSLSRKQCIARITTDKCAQRANRV